MYYLKVAGIKMFGEYRTLASARLAAERRVKDYGIECIEIWFAGSQVAKVLA